MCYGCYLLVTGAYAPVYCENAPEGYGCYVQKDQESKFLDIVEMPRRDTGVTVQCHCHEIASLFLPLVVSHSQ